MKIWQILALPFFVVSASFKVTLLLSMQEPRFADADHKISNMVLNWWIIILLWTTPLDWVFRVFAFGYVNDSLIVFKKETNEERRPLFEPKKNSGDNITNNDGLVHGKKGLFSGSSMPKTKLRQEPKIGLGVTGKNCPSPQYCNLN